MTIFEALSNAGISLQPDWSGERRRGGKKDAEWIYAHKWIHEGKEYSSAFFGSFSAGTTGVWKSWEGENLTKSESKYLKDELRKQKEKIESDKKENHEKTRQRVTEAFASFSSEYHEGYLGRKSIRVLMGAKTTMAATPLKPSEETHIVVPIRDIDHQLWNLQHIYDQGDKTFEKGGRKKGLFHLLETPHHSDWTSFDQSSSDAIYICEGFATAASVQLALGDDRRIVCALDSGNLEPVARNIRTRYPNAKLVFCADNDLHNSTGTNPGVLAAEKASQSVGGSVVIAQLNGKKCDFNDVHVELGLTEVTKQILNQLLDNKLKVQELDSLTQMNLFNASGKRIKPSAQQVAKHLLDYYGEHICVQDESLFVFEKTHWIEMRKHEANKLYQQLDFITGEALEPKDLKAYLGHLKNYIPSVPKGINMFTPNPFVANFSDQSLHFTRNKNGTYALNARPHTFRDYLTHVLPFPMPKMSGGAVVLPEAPKFEAWLDNLWANDLDKEQKIRLLYQIGGCCILPAFTTIAFFIGPPASGKSTIIKLLIKLIGMQNTSSVQPCLWNDFHMQPMLGKLINFDTDIDINRPMNDSMVKKVIDRAPVSVNRKNKDIVHAYLPPVHLFAGNDLPKSMDGRSKAYGRRLIIFQTDSFKAETGNLTNDFEEILINEERDAIVARLVSGALDLIALKGNFSVTKSSQEKVEEMEMNSDPYSQFMDEVKDGYTPPQTDAKIFIETGRRISVKKLWEFYTAFLKERVMGHPRVGYNEKRQLCEAMRKMGWRSEKVGGTVYFLDVGCGGPGATF